MANFVDRRLNPKGKNLGNRRRFLRRAREQIRHSMNETLRKSGIADVGKNGNVTVPTDGISEPTFHHAGKGGVREHVLPGNKTFRPGDQIDRPASGGNGRGRQGSPDGEAEDDFAFVLSYEEFLEVFFEDLELPDLVKRTLKDVTTSKPRRAGISVSGSPANLSVPRTTQKAFARRIALKRPKREETAKLKARIFELENVFAPSAEQLEELKRLREEFENLSRRQLAIPYIDPLDVRYNHFEQRPVPNARAVMFCLMDVSASMGEREKDLAKRFFVLLHLFLSRRYHKVELVFIRHTDKAKEVDEETFFHSRESGGTIVSSVLREMKKIIDERYPPSEWNIYAAQASDGDNYGSDSPNCASILNQELMRLCQHFAYIEILNEEEKVFIKSDDSGTALWMAYRGVAEHWRNFAMKRIATAGDIYPVFRELFSSKSTRTAA